MFYKKHGKLFQTFIEKIITSLGLDNTSFHAECKFDENAQTIKLIEIVGRAAGGFITSHLLPLASGHSFHEAVIQTALGEAVDTSLAIKDWSEKTHDFSGHLDIFETKEGIVQAIEGLDKVLENKNVLFAIPTVKIGHKVTLPPNHFSAQFLATAVVRAKSYEEVEQAFSWINKTIKVSMEVGV